MGDTGFEPRSKDHGKDGLKAPPELERSISVATRVENTVGDARLATIVAEWDALSEEDQADLWDRFQAACNNGTAATGYGSPPRRPESHQTTLALR